MTYEEIMKLPFSEKEEQLKRFYIEEIGVLEWLLNDGKKQKIVFNDRTEYKFKNVYHNIMGAAIQYNNGNMTYYINGELYSSKDKWNTESTRMLRRKKLERLIKMDE